MSNDCETPGPDVASNTKRATELLSDAVILLHADAEDIAIERIRAAGSLLGLRIDTPAQMYQDLKRQWTDTQIRQFQDSNNMKRFVGDSLYDAQMAQNLGTSTTTAPNTSKSHLADALSSLSPGKILGITK